MMGFLIDRCCLELLLPLLLPPVEKVEEQMLVAAPPTFVLPLFPLAELLEDDEAALFDP